jgi:hypothetical protein
MEVFVYEILVNGDPRPAGSFTVRRRAPAPSTPTG